MQITCPSCAAQYEIPDGLVAGRSVKCARCGQKWTPQTAERAAPTPVMEPAAPDPPRSAFHDSPAPVQSRPYLQDAPRAQTPFLQGAAYPKTAPVRARRPVGLLAAWIVSIAVLLAAAAAAYAGRQDIMQAWPASQRLYAALGLR